MKDSLRQAPAVEWSESLIALLSVLPRAELVPHLRHIGKELGLRDKCVAVLAGEPVVEDRPLFVEALNSPTPAIRALSLAALNKLPIPANKEESRATLC